MKYPYYRATEYMTVGDNALTTWFDHHEVVGAPVALTVHKSSAGVKYASIWVWGREYIGPMGVGNSGSKTGPNDTELNPEYIVREANGFRGLMG